MHFKQTFKKKTELVYFINAHLMSYHFRKVIPALFSGICGNRCVDIAEVVCVCMNTHSPCFSVPP